MYNCCYGHGGNQSSENLSVFFILGSYQGREHRSRTRLSIPRVWVLTQSFRRLQEGEGWKTTSCVTNFREKVFRKQEPPSCTICNQNMMINCIASSLRFKSQKRRQTFSRGSGMGIGCISILLRVNNLGGRTHHLSLSLDLVLLGGTQDVCMSHRGQNQVIENYPK